ncbi:diguanylate cyclase domain-containing protein [Butyrivibrio sp. FCS014]|uniref:diguanylate cyclase domain-containing protein n=1 Tax=Butyrivibrio sp. FCS014 TaxID=1408304 RepID=UPI00046746DA|nr:diguanylate cyclase [Butyrivibrio sp. FCS014]
MKKKSARAGLIAFVVTLVITTVIAIFYLNNAASSRRERAKFMADTYGQSIEAEIAAREYITRMLEIKIQESKGNITGEQFRIIAEELFDDFIDITDISLAPDGIVSFKYPLTGGLADRENLFSDNVQGVYADYSKMSGASILIAPAIMDDGSYGIIIRRPVYTSEEASEESFWGFVSVTLDLSRFLKAVSIENLAQGGYEYKLIGNNPITGEKRLIMEHSDRELATPVESMISTVKGGYWIIRISPEAGWMNPVELVGALAIAILFSALAAFAASAYMSMLANAKELEVMSYRDSLTNLYNPRSYHEHMDDLSKKKLPYGLIFMDLNDFKMVNDTMGHDVGDSLLNIVAKRLQNSIREKDRAFRIGGDEFVVVIHGVHDKQFYEGVIDRMRNNVAREVVIGEHKLNVSISAGFARCPEDGAKFEDVVKVADDAMYHNKRAMKAKRAAMGIKSARDSQ